jgi:hypothetical protein
MLSGVALLGHQTLTDLHKLISGCLDGSDKTLFSFHFGKSQTAARSKKHLIERRAEQPSPIVSYDRENADGVRLDHLNLKVGQTFEYCFELGDETWHKTIQVEAIDDE